MFTVEHILVLLPVNPSQKKLLQDAAKPASVVFQPQGQPDEGTLARADVIIGNPAVDLLKKAGHLKWLQLAGAGADTYTAEGMLPAGVILTTASGAYGLAVSEHIFAVMLALLKKLYLYMRDQMQRCWSDEGEVGTICGATVLVVGLGDIGSAFAVRAKAFGAHVIGVRRMGKGEKPDFVDELHGVDDLNRLLPRADVVMISLPGTRETKGLFSREKFALMKNTSILLNCGRGMVVDTEALYDALKEGMIQAAGLDVTDPEPLPPDHKLWSLRNILITPHISGGFHLPETLERVVQVSAQNLKMVMEGNLPNRLVDLPLGYAAGKGS